MGWSRWSARWTHNPKVAGSSPAPATNDKLQFMKYEPQRGNVVEIRGRKYFYLDNEKEEFEAEVQESEHHKGEDEWLFFLDLCGYEIAHEINGYYFNINDCCLNPELALDVSQGGYFFTITVAEVRFGMFDHGYSEHSPTSGGSSAPWYGKDESRCFPTPDDAILHAIESSELGSKWPKKIKAALDELKSTLTPSGRVIIPTGTQLALF